jgi:hypothetical protein
MRGHAIREGREEERQQAPYWGQSAVFVVVDRVQAHPSRVAHGVGTIRSDHFSHRTATYQISDSEMRLRWLTTPYPRLLRASLSWLSLSLPSKSMAWPTFEMYI